MNTTIKQSSLRLNALLGITAAGALLSSTANAALIGHWAFDEGSGATAGDSSGGGNPGAITDGTWGSDGTRASYLSFNGTSSFVDPTISLPAMSATNDFTWAVWASSAAPISGTQQNSIIIGNRKDGTNNDIPSTLNRQFVKFTPTKFEWHQNASANDNQEYDDLVVGEWHHIAVVKTGNSVQLYRDGIASGAPGLLAEDLSTAVALPFYIGGEPNQGVNEFFTGSIDDVRIYDNALSPAEVAALVIPEPSVALLGVLGLGIASLRRKR